MPFLLDKELVSSIATYCEQAASGLEPYEQGLVARLKKLVGAPRNEQASMIAQFTMVDWCWIAGSQQRQALVRMAFGLEGGADDSIWKGFNDRDAALVSGRQALAKLLELKERIQSSMALLAEGDKSAAPSDVQAAALKAVANGLRILYPEFSEGDVGHAMSQLWMNGLDRSYTLHSIELGYMHWPPKEASTKPGRTKKAGAKKEVSR